MTVFSEEAIFQIARRIDRPEARRLYLDQACAADDAMRARVEALLRVHDDERSFLERPAVAPPPQDRHSTAASADFPPLATIELPSIDSGTIIAGRYKLLEAIGEGGMGSVWMAEQTE